MLPPMGNLYLLLVALVFLFFNKRKTFFLLSIVSIVSAIGLGIPVVSHSIAWKVASHPPLDEKNIGDARAIVILGGGRDYSAPEFFPGSLLHSEGKSAHRHFVNSYTLRRLAYGAYLQRKTKLPVLVSGGAPYGEHISEAELMATAMNDLFKVRVKWTEEKSRNTRENAEFSAEILKKSGVRTVILVSHAWHVPRAVIEFRRHGLDVVPAPTEFPSLPEGSWQRYLPRPFYLYQSSLAIHEWLGMLWYAWTG